MTREELRAELSAKSFDDADIADIMALLDEYEASQWRTEPPEQDGWYLGEDEDGDPWLYGYEAEHGLWHEVEGTVVIPRRWRELPQPPKEDGR